MNGCSKAITGVEFNCAAAIQGAHHDLHINSQTPLPSNLGATEIELELLFTSVCYPLLNAPPPICLQQSPRVAFTFMYSGAPVSEDGQLVDRSEFFKDRTKVSFREIARNLADKQLNSIRVLHWDRASHHFLPQQPPERMERRSKVRTQHWV